MSSKSEEWGDVVDIIKLSELHSWYEVLIVKVQV
jgi:hypothetical protein